MDKSGGVEPTVLDDTKLDLNPDQASQEIRLLGKELDLFTFENHMRNIIFTVLDPLNRK